MNSKGGVGGGEGKVSQGVDFFFIRKILYILLVYEVKIINANLKRNMGVRRYTFSSQKINVWSAYCTHMLSMHSIDTCQLPILDQYSGDFGSKFSGIWKVWGAKTRDMFGE